MEEGSLLQVALEHAKSLRTASANDSLTRNCVFLDLYLLPQHGDNNNKNKNKNTTTAKNEEEEQQQQHLLDLAKLADRCNRYFQSKHHFWHYGADGPIFGIHLDDNDDDDGSSPQPPPRTPHLRAYCRYGPSVQDGWMALRYAMEFVQQSTRNNRTDETTTGDGNNSNNDARRERDVVASMWDVQDGQAILIQLADLLPPWLDEDPTDNHRYACWIDHSGTLQLLRKPHIALRDALHELSRNRTKQQQKLNLEATDKTSTKKSSSSSHPKLHEALVYWLDLNQEASFVHQRTPMVLPRTVARVFEERPELLQTALQAFCENTQQQADGPVAAEAQRALELLDFKRHEDWVWTVQSLSRTNYAMVRTVVSSGGGGSDRNNNRWTCSPDAIPTDVGVEVKRYRRRCKTDATKHLKHALALGIRAVAGMELLLLPLGKTRHGIFATSPPLSSLAERVFHWDRIQQRCALRRKKHNNGNDTSRRTIFDSFQVGPNKADVDLTDVLKCPVFPEEAQNWTPYSNPQTSLRDQIRGITRSKKPNHNNNDDDHNDEDNDDERFWMPRPDQIDGDDWMNCDSPPANSGTGTIKSQRGLDDLLSRFQSFLNQTSGMEGISSNEPSDGRNEDRSGGLEIRPRVFINILHAVLKGDKLEFPRIDPFFYQEDYDLARGHGDGDSDDDSDDKNNHRFARSVADSFQMNDLMVRVSIF